MELSSIELFKIISILNKEIESDNLYLNNIYQVMNDSYLFKLHQVGKPKKYVMINPKIGIWASKYDIEKDESTGYVTSLRKNLLRARLIKFEQPPGERICIMHFETKKGKRKVICEFFREGNIVVVDENNKILSCLKKLKVRHREIFPGNIYEFPPLRATSIENFEIEDLKSIYETDLEIAKWIGRNYSLSKKYIEEILEKTNIDKKKECNKLSSEEVNRLEKEILELVKIIKSHDLNVWVAKDGELIEDISLINLDHSKEKKYYESESMMDELDSYITLNLSKDQTVIKQEPINKKIIELEKSIKSQEEAYNNNKNKAIELRDLAIELSKANSYNEILTGKEIEIINYRSNIIKIPFIDSELEIDKEISAIKLSSLCFDQAKLLERKIKSIEIASLKLKKDLDKIRKKREVQEENKSSIKIKEETLWFEKFRWFISLEGDLVIGGRDSQSNVNIIKKYAKQNDLVFHSEIVGSPFFIIKEGVSDTTITEIATATASFSRAWKSESSVDVYYVRYEQVKKGAPSGMSMPKGSFMIEGKKTILKKVKLELAIGAVIHNGRHTIMSGPIDAVMRKASAYVIIRPGKRKSSDIAKLIKNDFISKLDNDISEIYKGKSIDEYLRVLPPGGAEIVDN
ncbi:MAG: hypothetical protein CMO19_00165 [Thaumarchaeota archaeon]|mgnify:CR=1 FL=1|nr:hypothetical protein [Nitrososphaerota archaeon]